MIPNQFMDAYELVDCFDSIGDNAMLDEFYVQEYRNDSGMETDLEYEINRQEYLEDKLADYIGEDE